MTTFHKQTATLARTLAMAAASAALVAGATVASADPQDQRQSAYQRADQGGNHQQADQGANRQQAGRNYASQQANGWGQNYQGDHQWRRGQRIGHDNWTGAQPVDYRAHHLRQPPRGYEWRESNGQYVMAAVATGLIASIILSNGR
jgi:Ni/Co efflux regulator RcnB